MDSRILVIGATGNIGSELVRQLRAQGADVVAGTRRASETAESTSLAVPKVHFDFRHPDSMLAAFRQVDRAFLLLPLVEEMVSYGIAAVDAAREAGLSFLVKSSELGADADSPRLALQAQGSVDHYLQESGISCTILRPNFFMQNFATHYLPAIVKRHGVFLPQASAKTSFIDVRDIAAAAAQVLLSPELHSGAAYDLTGPQALSNYEVAQHLATASGRSVDYHPLDEEAASQAMAQLGMPVWVVQFMMSLHQHVREGHMADISPWVQSITGRPPRAFQQFAQEYADVWKVHDTERKSSNPPLEPTR